MSIRPSRRDTSSLPEGKAASNDGLTTIGAGSPSNLFSLRRAGGNQRGDLFRAVSRLGKDLSRLLAEEGRREAGAHWLAVEVIRSTGHAQWTDPRMLDLKNEILGLGLAVVHRLRHVADRTAGNTRAVEATHHFVGGERFQLG